MTDKKLQMIGRIDQIIRDYFDKNKSISEVMAKDLMPLFIEKGIFTKDHRAGLPIRTILRELDAENKLDLLKHVKVVRNTVNRNWYFTRL
jgi:exo-beta-1,3-glucanase (GH17 family)